MHGVKERFILKNSFISSNPRLPETKQQQQTKTNLFCLHLAPPFFEP
jgi:hypothetical protein